MFHFDTLYKSNLFYGMEKRAKTSKAGLLRKDI